MTIQEQAMAYHINGYIVMPCHKDKRPALTSWKYLQTQRPTDDDILKWFSNNEINIGIVTGKLSDLTVIDIDNKGDNGQQRADDMLSKFPETRTIQSPSGGYHLYYKYDSHFTISANAYSQYPNVDIRGEGGFVCAPPSVTDKGRYTILKDIPIQPFPARLFPKTKPRKTLTEKTTAKKGNRNDTLASLIGTLILPAKEEDWYMEVLPAVERIASQYTPALPETEVRQVFDSIAKKEKERREGLIVSPIQIVDDDDIVIGEVKLDIRKTRNGIVVKDMANVVAVLKEHPYFKGVIKYNTFQQQIEYKNNALEDEHIGQIQYFMQTAIGLHGISQDAVKSAIIHVANQNKYDEAQDWLKSLEWDNIPRLATWLSSATGVPDDTYHRGIGSEWMMGIINRIMRPGCIWDYMLVLVGAQGVGKTSLFRIVGGKWYKSFTGNVENKDFYLALRGAIVMDLDEGATLYKSEAIKIKSIITQTHDEFREPYGHVMKKFPRRFVFSMSTNDSEPFRDVTGNRRYWVIDLPERMVDFKWLEDNRDQIFAEAYHNFVNKTDTAQVPMDEAREKQDAHLPDDSWTEKVMEIIKEDNLYCTGSMNYTITIQEIFTKLFKDETLLRLDRKQEMRIGNILRKEAGLEKKQTMVDGERKSRYHITEKKLKQLQAKNAVQHKSDIEQLTDELDIKQDPLYF